MMMITIMLIMVMMMIAIMTIRVMMMMMIMGGEVGSDILTTTCLTPAAKLLTCLGIAYL